MDFSFSFDAEQAVKAIITITVINIVIAFFIASFLHKFRFDGSIFYQRFFSFIVLIVEISIRLIAPQLFWIGLYVCSSAYPVSNSNSSQYSVSYTSLRDISNFEIKSFVPCAYCGIVLHGYLHQKAAICKLYCACGAVILILRISYILRLHRKVILYSPSNCAKRNITRPKDEYNCSAIELAAGEYN